MVQEWQLNIYLLGPDSPRNNAHLTRMAHTYVQTHKLSLTSWVVGPSRSAHNPRPPGPRRGGDTPAHLRALLEHAGDVLPQPRRPPQAGPLFCRRPGRGGRAPEAQVAVIPNVNASPVQHSELIAQRETRAAPGVSRGPGEEL